jgi:hypothetical protein
MALAHAHLSPPEAFAFAPALPPNKKTRAKVAHPFVVEVQVLENNYEFLPS